MKYTNFKLTWEKAKCLKLRAYFQIVPIWWWGITIFVTIKSFELSIFWLIAQVILYSFLIVNTIFYPWFRMFLSIFKLTRSTFPSYKDNNILSYAKLVCTETIRSYRETGYDYRTHFDNGEIYQTRRSDSKWSASVDSFLMNSIINPFFCFLFLNTIGIFSFILGWIYVPWCFNKVMLSDQE